MAAKSDSEEVRLREAYEQGIEEGRKAEREDPGGQGKAGGDVGQDNVGGGGDYPPPDVGGGGDYDPPQP